MGRGKQTKHISPTGLVPSCQGVPLGWQEVLMGCPGVDVAYFPRQLGPSLLHQSLLWLQRSSVEAWGWSLFPYNWLDG